jgi:hypothetical protein
MVTITATFHDRAATERAIDDLTAANIPRDDISIVMSNETRSKYFGGAEHVHGANIAKGAAGGGVIGGSLGAIAGGFLITGAITVATGGVAAPFLIAGPIAGALAGGGAGAAVGSIVGALVGAGIAEPQAKAIESEVKRGGVIVAVRTDESRDAIARAILIRDGADPGRSGLDATDSGAPATTPVAQSLRDDSFDASTGRTDPVTGRQPII